MTIERWTDERLDRLAAITESNARLIESNSQQIESNSRQILGLRDSISELRESSREQREDISALQITATALLQLGQQQQQFAEQSREEWDRNMVLHRESDQRFEIVLAELRHLIARMDGGEGAAAG
jgi:hypothetical protein